MSHTENRDNEKLSVRVVVGCQGWNYDDWVTPAAGSPPVFYPRGTRADRMLEAYARAFSSVEVDSTFYATPLASTFDGWRQRTPDRFTFALKLPREITHERALRGDDSARALELFCSRARRLGEKLAAVLVQLPPQFAASPENARALAEFLPLLPRDVRFSVEFRDPAWLEEGTLSLLARHPHVSPALVEGQWVTRERMWRAAEDFPSDFFYVRWMGERDLSSFDSVTRARDENLRDWHEQIARLARLGSTVLAYFSNFYEGHAPASANKLKRLLNQPVVEPEELEDQPSLF